jgi:hypothetical protein
MTLEKTNVPAVKNTRSSGLELLKEQPFRSSILHR